MSSARAFPLFCYWRLRIFSVRQPNGYCFTQVSRREQVQVRWSYTWLTSMTIILIFPRITGRSSMKTFLQDEPLLRSALPTQTRWPMVSDVVDLSDLAGWTKTGQEVKVTLTSGQPAEPVTSQPLTNGPPFELFLPCSGACPCHSNPTCSDFAFRYIQGNHYTIQTVHWTTVLGLLATCWCRT